jgi:hypothetical protein
VSAPAGRGPGAASGEPRSDRGTSGALAEVAAAADPALAPYAMSDPGPARFGHELGDRRFVLEAVYEGYLLHYGDPRLFDGMDRDLRLLAGDALYAVGLARLAERGDLTAVAELSDLITRSARAHAEGRGADAEALWDASARLLATAPR